MAELQKSEYVYVVDVNGEIQLARQQGVQQGVQQGKAEGIEESMRVLRNLGLSDDMIRKALRELKGG